MSSFHSFAASDPIVYDGISLSFFLLVCFFWRPIRGSKTLRIARLLAGQAPDPPCLEWFRTALHLSRASSRMGFRV